MMKSQTSSRPELRDVAAIVDGLSGERCSPESYVEMQEQRERARRAGRFIAGPIPVDWMARALRLKASAGKVGVVLFFQRGLCGRDEFRIEPARFRELDIDKSTRRRGLLALEEVGLIAVQREPGRSPVVTILDL